MSSRDRHLFAQLASSRDLECTNGGVPVLVARGAGVQSADLQITGAVEEGHPLTDHDEIYALRYATMTGRQPHQNYLLPDVHNEGTDLGYFVWLIRGEAGDILVNTGFN